MAGREERLIMPTATEIRARRRTLTKQLREQNSAWIVDWYANSAGGCVLESYKAGNVVVIDADANMEARRNEIGVALSDAKIALLKAEDAIDAAYWRFTRCARGQPVPGHLYDARNAARDRVEDLRRKLAEF